eukprot:UN25716
MSVGYINLLAVDHLFKCSNATISLAILLTSNINNMQH